MNFKELLNINNSIIDNLKDECKFIYNSKIYKYNIEDTKIVVNYLDFIKENKVFKKVIEIDLKGYQNSWEINVYYPFVDRQLIFHKTCFHNEKVIILPFDNIIEILKKIFLEVCDEE